jgi:hypothetical protein
MSALKALPLFYAFVACAGKILLLQKRLDFRRPLQCDQELCTTLRVPNT